MKINQSISSLPFIPIIITLESKEETNILQNVIDEGKKALQIQHKKEKSTMAEDVSSFLSNLTTTLCTTKNSIYIKPEASFKIVTGED